MHGGLHVVVLTERTIRTFCSPDCALSHLGKANSCCLCAWLRRCMPNCQPSQGMHRSQKSAMERRARPSRFGTSATFRKPAQIVDRQTLSIDAYATAHMADSNSACASTVLVASSCKSGGYQIGRAHV